MNEEGKEKFTPKPWSAAKREYNGHGFLTICDINGKDIAIVCPRNSKEETLANLYLIQASPALYCALKNSNALLELLFSCSRNRIEISDSELESFESSSKTIELLLKIARGNDED